MVVVSSSFVYMYFTLYMTTLQLNTFIIFTLIIARSQDLLKHIRTKDNLCRMHGVNPCGMHVGFGVGIRNAFMF